jgi:hypothetical protein
LSTFSDSDRSMTNLLLVREQVVVVEVLKIYPANIQGIANTIEVLSTVPYLHSVEKMIILVVRSAVRLHLVEKMNNQ